MGQAWILPWQQHRIGRERNGKPSHAVLETKWLQIFNFSFPGWPAPHPDPAGGRGGKGVGRQTPNKTKIQDGCQTATT